MMFFFYIHTMGRIPLEISLFLSLSLSLSLSLFATTDDKWNIRPRF